MTTDASMTTSSETIKTEVASRPFSQLILFSLPYWALVLSQSPLSIIYVRNLWIRQPHYRFLPFLALVMLWLAWERRPLGEEKPIVKSFASLLFLGFGVLAGVAATAFADPWLAALATCCFLAAWFARIRDVDAGGTLFHVGLLSFLGLQLPLGLDVRLIQYLQRVSAYCSSRILELFGQMHDMPGTVLIFPGRKEYFVEEACSGVQSLFTLLFCAGAYSVWQRYSLPRIFTLLLAASGWAVLMNSLRILAIPMAEIHWGVDLVSGWKHEALGYSALILAIAMMLSTDRLLAIVLTPLHRADGPVAAAKRITKRHRLLWFAGRAGGSRLTPSDLNWRSPGYLSLWALVLVFVMVGILQATDVRNMMSNTRRSKSFFDQLEIVKLGEEDLPVSVGPWTCQDFTSEDRTRSSELGEHSDTWKYVSSRYLSVVSLDQPFPGWHELSVCYTNQGWKIKQRTRVADNLSGGDSTWPYVEIMLQNDLGEFGYLLFSFFDTQGQPFDAPDEWNSMTSLYHRLRNRLSYRFREQLFQSETYQVQVFVPSTRPLSDEELDEIRQNYSSLREQLRRRLLDKRSVAESASL